MINYEQVVQSKDFIEFQRRILAKYYGEDKFTTIFDYSYPAFTIPGDVKYPFTSLTAKDFEPDKNLDFKHSKYYEKYKSVIGEHVKRPKMQGFMLDHFDMKKNKITTIHTWVGTYEENVYTSHILEYELYELFKEREGKTLEELIQEMTLRNGIHTIDSYGKFDLQTGLNRASLLGVQLLILYKTRQGDYEVVTIKRSKDVAVRPGFYQFVPSGGFETFENSQEHCDEELEKNYNVLSAILKEYMEELFGMEEYDFGKDKEPIASINKEEEVKRLVGYINSGTAHFEFLGSVVDLCELRHDLSFVLRIDNPEYGEKVIFHSNSESKKVNRLPMRKLADLNPEKINPSSAALWYLFTESHLFKEIK